MGQFRSEHRAVQEQARQAESVLDALLSGVPMGLKSGIFIGMLGWKGTTIGGAIMGIKCYRINGTPLDYGVSGVRALSSIFSFMVLGLGFFWAGWDGEKQSWHDKIAGTIVVRMPPGTSLL